MQIYQPMLFVGLGGTGCRIGAELERRLREELCGPDGTALLPRMQGMLPYQLPGCLQFVYADLAEDEYRSVRKRVVPDPAHLPAAEHTMRMVRDLVPSFDIYPEVAQALRVNAAEYVSEWLPPAQHEPRVGPLSKGAGQLPTIARAALFETFRNGLAAARASLDNAIGDINLSGGQLEVLGGRLRGSVDVFVAFSVAGGTGGGLFFDYLHLIGDTLGRHGYRVRIFPLVLMPSAFAEGMGGGRPAVLNAGQALLDLFRLVDDQNARGGVVHHSGVDSMMGVRYPNAAPIRLRPNIVQTAFLFSLSPGMHRDDLHRSVVALLLSLAGASMAAPGDGGPVVQGDYMSFPEIFINAAAERGKPAPSGIGKCGVSTSSVASMTVPLDDLAEIVSCRLLAEAIHELRQPGPGQAENNAEPIGRFFADAGIDQLRERAPEGFREPPAAEGLQAVINGLSRRKRAMEAALEALKQRLAHAVPEMAQSFNPGQAIHQRLATTDLFRTNRIVLGHPNLSEEASKLGFSSILKSRRAELPPPHPGMPLAGPNPTAQRAKWYRRVHWSDPSVQSSIREQDVWYRWRAQREWHTAWDDQFPVWDRKMREAERGLRTLVDEFAKHANEEDARFARLSKALYEPRVGVSYLLPRHGDLGAFYTSVFRRLVDIYADLGRLAQGANAGQLVNQMLGDRGWQEAYEVFRDNGLERGPRLAVAHVRDKIKTEVLKGMRHSDEGRSPVLASLHDLLLAASGQDTARVDEDDLRQFKEKLAGLVPGGYAPKGTGHMKIFFSYSSAAGARDPRLETYLRQTVNLPHEAGMTTDFRPIDAESIVVVLFRSEMGLAEVPEVREVLRYWADALANEQPQDFLQWRQRLVYRFGYLATTEEDRTHILHRLLCAVWNGDVEETGDPDSPDSIMVHFGAEGTPMTLDLDPFGRRASWGSVLSSYERWVLTDNHSINQSVRRDLCARLMTTLPEGLDRRPGQPSEMFRRLVALADTESKALDEQLAKDRGGRRRLEALHEFWSRTFPAAMEQEFLGVQDPLCPNLRALLDEWGAQ